MKTNENPININSPSFPRLPLIPQAAPGSLRLPRLSRLPLAQYRNRQLADDHKQQAFNFEENEEGA